MKLNRKLVVISILLILLLLLICWRQCGRIPESSSQISMDTISSRTNIINNYKTDTIIKILNVYKEGKDTFVIIRRDTIFQEKNIMLIDSLHNLLIFQNTNYQDKLRKEEECIQENKVLKTLQKQKDDSIQMLLLSIQALQKERDFLAFERKQEIDIGKNKEEFWAKNILFTGLFTDVKTGRQLRTIYGGLLKDVLLSMDFITTIPVQEDNRIQTIYIKISDLQTEQLIYLTVEKPKDWYVLENGEKINYSLQTQITFDQQNTAKFKITYPMKWMLKRNSAIKVEVFCNRQKIGEHINEIKSGIPVTTW